ncbi:MAG: outer membrane beta-barrel protein [Betaproteobacteria bacterium]
MIARIVLMTAALLAAGSAVAQDKKIGLYAYGSVGVSMGKYDSAAAQARGEAAVGPGTTFTEDTDRYSGKALIGYRFNKYFGIEGGYVDVAKIRVDSSGPGGTFGATYKLRGGQVGGIAWLPMSDELGLFLRAGAAIIRSTYKPTAGVDDRSTDVQTYFGVGLQYDFSTDFFGRAEYERYSKFGNASTGDISANIYSLGLGYKF